MTPSHRFGSHPISTLASRLGWQSTRTATSSCTAAPGRKPRSSVRVPRHSTSSLPTVRSSGKSAVTSTLRRGLTRSGSTRRTISGSSTTAPAWQQSSVRAVGSSKCLVGAPNRPLLAIPDVRDRIALRTPSALRTTKPRTPRHRPHAMVSSTKSPMLRSIPTVTSTSATVTTTHESPSTTPTVTGSRHGASEGSSQDSFVFRTASPPTTRAEFTSRIGPTTASRCSSQMAPSCNRSRWPT